MLPIHFEREYRLAGERVLARLINARYDSGTKCETELAEAGISVPLPHRTDWLLARGIEEVWRVEARQAETGRCLAAFALHVEQSKLPGHLLLRVERFGPSVTDGGCLASLHLLRDVSREVERILRANVEVFIPEARRVRVDRMLESLGFRPVVHTRSYHSTLQVDLRQSEPELLASFHGTARRHIRAIQKHPVEVRTIEDPTYAPRLTALFQETLRRTQTTYRPIPWRTIIEYAATYPDLARVAALCRTDVTGPDALLSFALGLHHGDSGQYATAASTRDGTRVPLGYALAWDLMRWAKARGAGWFDFGGIALPEDRLYPALAGAARFKRFFGGQVVRVGSEWRYEPRPVRAALSRNLGTAVEWMGNLLAVRRMP